MKKITIALFLVVFLAQSSVAFARINEDQNIAGNKGTRVLTTDVADLQAQIDQLNQKNAQLELRLLKEENEQPIQTIISNDTGEGDMTRVESRVNLLEKRVSTLEGLLNGLKTSISKVLDLLTKLLAKI